MTQEQWDAVLDTRGFNVLTGKRIYSREQIAELATIAVSPDQRIRRDSLLAIPMEIIMEDINAYMEIMMLRNYTDMDRAWEEVLKFRKSYDFQDTEAQAIGRLRDFIPHPIDSLLVFPSLDVLCMDAEARSLDGNIIVDLNLMYTIPEYMPRLVAHEMFHSYRYALLDQEYLKSDPVIRSLDLLLNEGLTDQVDKKGPFDIIEAADVPQEVAAAYRETYNNTPAILEEFDRLAVAYMDGDVQDLWRKAYHLIPYEGHANGYYMVSMIKRQGLLDELMENMVCPVAFARIYNKAAAAEGGYVFSSRMMEYIENSKRNYYARK